LYIKILFQMTKHKSPIDKNIRLGSKNNEHHVAQSLACITLGGLQPGERAISLATLMANGKITPEEAINILKSWHNHY